MLDAARKLFSERGYHGVSLSDIADQAGLSVGFIYYVFPKKEDILVEIVKEISMLYRNVFDQVAALSDPAEQLDTVFFDYLQGCDRNPQVLKILYKDLSAVDKASREEILSIERRTIEKIAAIIEDGQRKGVFRPGVSAHLAAYNMIGVGHLWALKHGWLFRGSKFDDYAAEQHRLFRAMVQMDPPS